MGNGAANWEIINQRQDHMKDMIKTDFFKKSVSQGSKAPQKKWCGKIKKTNTTKERVQKRSNQEDRRQRLTLH